MTLLSRCGELQVLNAADASPRTPLGPESKTQCNSNVSQYDMFRFVRDRRCGFVGRATR